MKDAEDAAVVEEEDGCTSWLVYCTSSASFDDWEGILVDSSGLQTKSC